MKINILAFGIAKDIIRGNTLSIELPEKATVGSLKEELTTRFPDFQKLRSLAIAVNTEYQSDDHPLTERDEVVIIPPVSGG
jgi:molybdopterin converting factor subunit 1